MVICCVFWSNLCWYRTSLVEAWIVPSFQAIYCSPGARAECLQIVFVVIGGRLRCTVQRPSSPSSSSSSRVEYEWRRPKSSVVWKQWRTSSSEVQQRHEEPLNLLYYYLGVKSCHWMINFILYILCTVVCYYLTVSIPVCFTTAVLKRQYRQVEMHVFCCRMNTFKYVVHVPIKNRIRMSGILELCSFFAIYYPLRIWKYNATAF